jgi:hypothetical protein
MNSPIFTPTTVSRAEQIDHIMKSFDFARVAKAMHQMNWTWAGSLTIPSIREMKEVARDHLERLTNGIVYSSSGGFVASVDQWGHLQLSFVVTECEAGEFCAAKEGNYDY